MTHPTDQETDGPEVFAKVAAKLGFGTEGVGDDWGGDWGDDQKPNPASAQTKNLDNLAETGVDMTQPEDGATNKPDAFAAVAAKLSACTEGIGGDLGDYPDPDSAQTQTWDDWHEGPIVSPAS